MLFSSFLEVFFHEWSAKWTCFHIYCIFCVVLFEVKSWVIFTAIFERKRVIQVMHSNRMRTVRCSSRLPADVCLGAVYSGVFSPRGCLPRWSARHPSMWTEWSDRCKNITFAATSLRTVKMPFNSPLIARQNVSFASIHWTVSYGWKESSLSRRKLFDELISDIIIYVVTQNRKWKSSWTRFRWETLWRKSRRANQRCRLTGMSKRRSRQISLVHHVGIEVVKTAIFIKRAFMVRAREYLEVLAQPVRDRRFTFTFLNQWWIQGRPPHP